MWRYDRGDVVYLDDILQGVQEGEGELPRERGGERGVRCGGGGGAVPPSASHPLLAPPLTLTPTVGHVAPWRKQIF